jgi:hypothetical protein
MDILKKTLFFINKHNMLIKKSLDLVIDTGTIGEDHIIMNLGDISDIARISSSNEINKLLKINFTEETELNV